MAVSDDPTAKEGRAARGRAQAFFERRQGRDEGV